MGRALREAEPPPTPPPPPCSGAERGAELSARGENAVLLGGSWAWGNGVWSGQPPAMLCVLLK